MELASILDCYRDRFTSDQQLVNMPSFSAQKRAVNAMISCRTESLGEIQVYCPNCDEVEWYPHSCGHRSCPKCQNHETGNWLERQQQKLLPVTYFMITFTLPAELRQLTYFHQKKVYELLLKSAVETLKELGLNPKRLGGLIGMTAVLHTQTRRLDYHPHVHIVVPGIAYNPEKRLLIRSSDSFFIRDEVVSKKFRGKFLFGLKALGFHFPANTLYNKDWVVKTIVAGKGEPALKYLSRYLYRGVISERNILSHQNGEVTFQYIDSDTKRRKTRILPGYEFVKLVLKHVLPRGFRRVRDFGFLHGNAKKTLHRLQLLLIPKLNDKKKVQRPAFKCRKCGHLMQIIAVQVFRFVTEKRSRSPPKLIKSVP
jgi:hypothetical protein